MHRYTPDEYAEIRRRVEAEEELRDSAELRTFVRNIDLLEQAVARGAPMYAPKCAVCGNPRSTTRDASSPSGYRYYCNHCRTERRRADGTLPQDSEGFREKMRALALEDGRQPPRRDSRTSLDG